MFVRAKSSGKYQYLQVVENQRVDGRVQQRVIATLGRLDVLRENGEIDALIGSFRSAKSILETRSIYHKRYETIRGHVFCSFLALVLLKELYGRLEARGWRDVEWQRLKDDLEQLEDITVINAGRSFVIRSDLRGDAGKAIHAAGVALGPVVRLLDPPETLTAA